MFLPAALFSSIAYASIRRTRRMCRVRGWEREDHKNDFLKEVDSELALGWVREQNAHSFEKIGDPEKSKFYDNFFKILTNKDTIPHVTKVHGHFYNFWQDEEHPRGIWRRTTLDDFKNQSPNWEILLDIDVLNKLEEKSWVWQSFDYNEFKDANGDEPTRVLLFLSPGGSDARVVREFDLVSKSFVTENAFTVMEASKTRCTWKSSDTLFIGTDFQDKDSLTDSGYPKTVREWRRGTPLSESKEVYRGEISDVAVSGYVFNHRDYKVEVFSRAKTFYSSEFLVKLPNSAAFVPLLIPNDADINQFANFLLITIKTAWTINGVTYESGSLLSVDMNDFVHNTVNAKSFVAIFTPTKTCSLEEFSKTRNYLVLHVLDNVKSRLIFWKFNELSSSGGGGSWEKFETEDAGAVRGLSIRAVDNHESDKVWYTVSSFVKPQTLILADAGQGAKGLSSGVVYKVRSSDFDNAGYVETQGEVTSLDGTKVPFFLIYKEGLQFDGMNPTLLYGYGGFEISLTPSYLPLVGEGWLQRGGVFAYANIRGGGEFGPTWHQAALKENRNKAYEDFEAIAEDLIAKKITSSKHLGIRGGSNGGLLMGNMMVRRPDLFGAIVCQVPLLDMKCFNTLLAGNSWMAEYGNPDTQDWWNFLHKYSAYHNIDSDRAATEYPSLLMISSTKDDRVHPYHARSFVKRLKDLKNAAKARLGGGAEAAEKVPDNVFYYENIEGGHGGAADHKQQAYVNSLYIMFLWQTIGRK